MFKLSYRTYRKHSTDYIGGKALWLAVARDRSFINIKLDIDLKRFTHSHLQDLLVFASGWLLPSSVWFVPQLWFVPRLWQMKVSASTSSVQCPSATKMILTLMSPYLDRRFWSPTMYRRIFLRPHLPCWTTSLPQPQLPVARYRSSHILNSWNL